MSTVGRIDERVALLQKAGQSQRESIEALKSFRYRKTIKPIDLNKLIGSYQTAFMKLNEAAPNDNLAENNNVKPKATEVPETYQWDVNRYNFGFASKNKGSQTDCRC